MAEAQLVPRWTSRQWKKEILWSLHPWIVLNSTQLFLDKGTFWNWSLLPWDWASCPLLPKSGRALAPMIKANSQAAVDRMALCDFQVCEEAGRGGHPGTPATPLRSQGCYAVQLLPTDLRRPQWATSRRLPRFHFAAFSGFPQGGCLDITHSGSSS